MTADIIPMPERNKGNGARKALMEVYSLTSTMDATAQDVAIYTDWVLMQLASRGFIVVPLEDK